MKILPLALIAGYFLLGNKKNTSLSGINGGAAGVFLNQIIKLFKWMQKPENEKYYYDKEKLLIADLKTLLTMNLKQLTKQQLFNVIYLCSRYRPYQPHYILTILSHEQNINLENIIR